MYAMFMDIIVAVIVGVCMVDLLPFYSFDSSDFSLWVALFCLMAIVLLLCCFACLFCRGSRTCSAPNWTSLLLFLPVELLPPIPPAFPVQAYPKCPPWNILPFAPPSFPFSLVSSKLQKRESSSPFFFSSSSRCWSFHLLIPSFLSSLFFPSFFFPSFFPFFSLLSFFLLSLHIPILTPSPFNPFFLTRDNFLAHIPFFSNIYFYILHRHTAHQF